MCCESWTAQICGRGFIWRRMIMIYQRQQLVTLAAPGTDLQLPAGEGGLSFVARTRLDNVLIVQTGSS